MKKLYATLFTLLYLSLLPGGNVWAQRVVYHRISANVSPERLEYLFNHGLSVDHFSYENKQNFTAEVSDADVAVMKRNGVKVTYLIKDLEKNYRLINDAIDREAARTNRGARAAAATTPTNFSLGSYAGHYTFAEMQTILDRMRTKYPNLISVKTSAGTTLGGRPIVLVKISDNPDVDENEPKTLLNAVHHAREPISMTQLIYFMWHVLENYATDKEVRTLLNSTELYIIPCLNPDGYVYNQTTNPGGGGMWRKNRKLNSDGTYGVDINRNYAYYYALDNSGSSPTPSAENYRGTGAFSELETAAIRDLMLKYTFTTAFNYHSYNNSTMYPFSALNPNSNPELAKFRSAAQYLTVENAFTIGNTYETLGYTSNGGAPDWQYGEQTTKAKSYAFTTEIGSSSDGFWPATSRIIPLCVSTLEMNRKMLRMSTLYGRAAASGSSSFSTKTSALRYNFQNFGIKPGTLTLSARPLSPYVTSMGGSKTYANLGLLQTVPDSLVFSVADSTPVGTPIAFEVTVDNGLSPIKDTLTLTYTQNCGTPAGLAAVTGQTSSTLNWGAVAGATTYALSTKPSSSTAWSAEVAVSATSFVQTGLTPNTSYDWRVKPTCGSFATGTFKTKTQTCFRETGGLVIFEAEQFKTSTAGTSTAAGRVWSPVVTTSASSGTAMTVSGTGLNLANSLTGPRLDYTINFATTGTYYVWVRMAAGSSTTNDDSFHIGLDGTATTLNPATSNYNNGSRTYSWIKAAGSTAFKVVVNTVGEHTFNIWMREDGTIVDKFILTTSASYTPSGTGAAVSSPCTGASGARQAVAEFIDETPEALSVLAYPNPMEHTLTVELAPADQDASLRLIDLMGRTQRQDVLPAGETQRQIGVSTLQPGAYFLEVVRDGKRRVLQLRRP